MKKREIMKRVFLISLLSLLSFSLNAQRQSQEVKGYPITPVSFTKVKVAPGTFWGQRLETSRKVTIPLAFSKCEESGRYANFVNAAEHIRDNAKTFKV